MIRDAGKHPLFASHVADVLPKSEPESRGLGSERRVVVGGGAKEEELGDTVLVGTDRSEEV